LILRKKRSIIPSAGIVVFVPTEGARLLQAVNKFIGRFASAALIGFSLLGVISGAQAYTLDTTDLSLGGTISGSIFYDIYGYLDDTSPGFTVSNGSYPYSGVNFGVANASLTYSADSTIWDLFVPGTYSPLIQLVFIGDLLTGPATLVTGIGGPSFICGAPGGWLCAGTGLDYLTSGSFDGVANDFTPLPPTWTTLIAGLIGLGFLANSRSKRSASAKM
jgi:hypothetical protein